MDLHIYMYTYMKFKAMPIKISTKQNIAETRSNSDYQEATSHRLKRDEAAVRNQDKKAIAADSWYRPQNLAGQQDPSK